MGITYNRHERPLIFLCVLILHGAGVWLLLRAHYVLQAPHRHSEMPWVFLLLPRNTPRSVPAPAATSAADVTTPRRKKLAPRTAEAAVPVPAEATPTPTPQIDWDHEAQVAARKQLSDLEKERDYRNLGGLSEAQLKFVRDNHLVPMAPGIVWAHPRVEVDQATLIPIIHINEHCVLILWMVFCSIGHIEPNGHLLDHMHEPSGP